jgi:hypothetical protein
MRHVSYVYGLVCVALLVAAVLYFPSVLLIQLIATPFPLAIQKPLAYICIAIPLAGSIAYLAWGVLKYKRVGIPNSFSGWRYALATAGLGVLVLSSLLIVFALLSAKTPGGMSGVPLGLGLVMSLLLVLPAMTTTRK